MCSCLVSVYSFLTIYCWLVKTDISAKIGNDIVTDPPGDYIMGKIISPEAASLESAIREKREAHAQIDL